MDLAELKQELDDLGVTPPDIYRASLYLDYLTNAQTFFQTTLQANIGAANYAFVSPAVNSANLLNEMAEMFDLYIGPAVAAALQANDPNDETYAEYFENNILTNAYPATLTPFRALYTVSTAALPLLFGHFTGNVQQACQRVYADRAALDSFFNGIYPSHHHAVQSLRHIKSTGSDFHKGGKQVLILTMDVDATGPFDDSPASIIRKIVYKPSDVEADCLLAGKAAVINAIVPGFMTASLLRSTTRSWPLIKSRPLLLPDCPLPHTAFYPAATSLPT